MFEQPGADRLATWQLPCPPEQIQPGHPIMATRIADHRKAYLTYEGPISNDRGQVAIHSRGTYLADMRTPYQWRITLHSSRGELRLSLKCATALEQCGNQATPSHWTVETTD
jgi:hypothetical protein